MTPKKRCVPQRPKKKKGAAPTKSAPSKKQQPNYKAIQNRSTATADQHAKILALLKQGRKTTVDLRRHGVMMPATRIFELKRLGHVIITELLTQYDDGGFRHNKVARYQLVDPQGSTGSGAA